MGLTIVVIVGYVVAAGLLMWGIWRQHRARMVLTRQLRGKIDADHRERMAQLQELRRQLKERGWD